MSLATERAGTGTQPLVNQSALWANRANYTIAGNVVRFTDFGGGLAGTGGGTYCYYTGTRWKPQNSVALLDRIDTQNDGTAGATALNLNPNAATIVAGQIGNFDAVEFLITPLKTGGVAETATFQLRIGSAFTTSDALIAQFTLTAVELAGGFIFRIKRTSATTFVREGSGSAQDSFGGGSALAQPVSVALNGADNFDTVNMRLSLFVTMSAATEIPSLRGYRATLEATDS